MFDEVITFTRDLVGSHGTEDLGYIQGGRTGVFDVEPVNPRARRINIIAEQFFIVTVGDDGGRWELSYSDEDIRLARRIIAATVAGRVEERRAFGRPVWSSRLRTARPSARRETPDARHYWCGSRDGPDGAS